MQSREAVELIEGGVVGGGTWADLGAGSGTFTRALAELVGAAGTVYAVDRDARAMAWLTEGAERAGGARLLPMVADFRQRLPFEDLDGVIVSNALHFVHRADQERVVGLLASYLRPHGTLMVVEYDQRAGTPWVPHPVPPDRFAELAAAAGLSAPREVGRRRSRYGPRDIYAAVARRPDAEG